MEINDKKTWRTGKNWLEATRKDKKQQETAKNKQETAKIHKKNGKNRQK